VTAGTDPVRADDSPVTGADADTAAPATPSSPSAALPGDGGVVPGDLASRARAARREFQQRFRREERQEFRYHLSIACAVFFSWLMWALPFWVREQICVRGGDALMRRSRTYRENVLANLGRVIPEASDEDLLRAARHVFHTSARNFMDLVLIPRIPRRRFLEDARLVAGEWEMLDRGLAAGKGLVLISAHLGAFDFIGQAVHARGYPLTTVTTRTTSRFVFDGVTHLRRSNRNEIVEATPSGVRRVLQALKRGEIAVFVTDRDFFQNGKPVTLFGRETTLPPGAVRIARDSGAPIVAIWSRRVGRGYEVELEGPFAIEKTSDREGDVQRGIEFLAGLLERAIGRTPDQWVMFQRVWPAEPADPIRVFPVGSPLESELLERVAAVLPEPRRPRPEPEPDPATPPPAAAPTDRTDPPPGSSA